MTPGRSLLKTGNKAGAKIDSVWKICRNPKKSKRMTLQLSFSDWIKKKNMNLFKNIFRNLSVVEEAQQDKVFQMPSKYAKQHGLF